MATILLAAAGAFAGAGFGGTVLGLSGAVIGRAVGATLGRAIDQRLFGAGSEAVETGRGKILQTSSEVCGSLPPDWRGRLGDLLFRLLPAGSVSGAPKEWTVRAIREAEPCPRGFYTGVFGFFDGESLDSAVAIRFVEETDAGLVYRSGGGITVLSDVEEEYRELIDKVYVPFAF